MPEELTDPASRAQIYNGLVASGFAQIGAKAALDLGDDDVAAATAEWQLRRDETLRQLEGLPVVPPHGAWSALLDAGALGIAPAELSIRLLEHKVAATPMGGWGGDVASRHLRFVFSNEPVDRLRALGDRVRAALG
jgi:aspartate/methionine/tyrosine aminotransferase